MNSIETITIRPFQSEDIEQIAELEQKYRSVYPEATKTWLKSYQYNPVFKGGRHILCACDETGQLVAHGHVYPLLATEQQPLEQPHYYYPFVKVDPAFAEVASLTEAMYARLVAMIEDIRQSIPPRASRLRIEQVSSETEIIDFYKGKGYTLDHKLFEMHCNVAEYAAESQSLPEGVEIRNWPIQTDEEANRFLAAQLVCFPEEPMGVEGLRFVMGAQHATTFTAFDGEEIAGSILVNAKFIDSVFVMPNYRGQGVAQAMIREALGYLKQHGQTNVGLYVEENNTPAVKAYQAVGFKKQTEIWIMEAAI